MSPEPLFPIFYDWEISTLGDIVARGGGSIQTGPFGSQLHASDYVDHGIPSIMPQNIANDRISEEGIARITEEDAKRLSKYRVRKGDIIYSRRGDVERRALVRQEHDGWLCGTGCLKVSFGHGLVVPEYAAFYLSHPASRSWVVQHAVGATMPNLNTSILSALPFVLPPISEQKRIASALGSLDEKIELNRQMNETLEEMARALFRDWFIDFGPTRRQMDGATDPAAIMGHAFPDDKAAALAPLFPARLGEDGLPDKWIKKPVGELSEIVGGGTPNTKTREFWEGGTHLWATPRDLSKLSGVFIRVTERQLTDAGLEKISSGLSPKGSVLMSSRAPIGYLAIASERVAVNQGFIVLRPTKAFPTYFAKLWCEANMETIEANANGSTFREISKKNFKPILAMVPSAEVLEVFSYKTDLLFGKIKANEHENQTLAEIRDLFLPKLMSGEIQLKDAPRVQDTLD